RSLHQALPPWPASARLAACPMWKASARGCGADPMLWPWSSPAPLIELRGRRMSLRLPQMRDYEEWAELRRVSRPFLKPFEPRWTEADLSRRLFAMRVKRARQEAAQGTDYTFLLFVGPENRQTLAGGMTLSNIRRR